MMNSITFNQLSKHTRDGKYTQKDLIRRIGRIAKSKGADKTITTSVINSFVTNGIIETYDELGDLKWSEMIRQMVSHEIAERR